MNTKIDTLSRLMISVFYIGNGISLMHGSHHIGLLPESFGSTLFLVIGSVELLAGLFLFLGYKISAAGIMLIVSTLMTALLLQSSILGAFQELAIAAGLFLLLNNNPGEPFLEYAQTDIKDLPNYKVKM